MITIGVSAFYHDSAVAIFDGEKLIFAAHEERFSRKKHDSSFPLLAIAEGLDFCGLVPSQVGRVVFYEKPIRKFDRIFEGLLWGWPTGFEQFRVALKGWFGGKLNHRKLLREHLANLGILVPESDILFSEHHLSHAATCSFASPFDDALVVVLDAVGEWESGSIWTYRRGNGVQVGALEKISALYYPHSLGMLYSAVTAYLGFRVNSGEYKVMGLAPYGVDRYSASIKKHLMVGTGKDFALKLGAFSFMTSMEMFKQSAFFDCFGIPPRRPDDPIEAVHCDIAKSIQVVLNETVGSIVRHFTEMTGETNLCLGGGVALNCVTNTFITENVEGIDGLYVHPASGDAGGAIGGAAAVIACLDKVHPEIGESPYLGKSYEGDIDTLVASLSQENLEIAKLEEARLLELVAKALFEGCVVGWYSGRSEFGPRALGNRSILASPLLEEAQKHINLKIKYREGFRPFAPIVKEEQFDSLFEGKGDYRYMLKVANVRSFEYLHTGQEDKTEVGVRLKSVKSKIPAVTHVDGTARVQTVSDNSNRIYKLLESFEEISGVACLVNTSFNVRGEPPVETPYDAVKCFLACEMDLLVLENVVVKKRDPGRSLFVGFEDD